MDPRRIALAQWAGHQLSERHRWPASDTVIEALSGDASFRRYFRARLPDITYILVDAPPDREDCAGFIALARQFRAAGLHSPTVWAADLDQGFMLLEDFGDTLLLDVVRNQSADSPVVQVSYDAALDTLLTLQAEVDASHWRSYDGTLLQQEMSLFEDWFCGPYLGMALSAAARQTLHSACDFLTEAALAQPQVAVHRDYHARNLMRLPEGLQTTAPGVIDFQDAVRGPCTYDLVSLLRDCYVRWPDAFVRAKALRFQSLAQARGLLPPQSEAAFLRDFDLMGVQRHLKVLGIFCRLYLRDGKAGYLRDLPLVMRYFLVVAERHPELDALTRWVRSDVLPLAEAKFAELGP